MIDSGIYQIRNLANGKRYIGSSATLETRRKRHFGQLRRGKHHSRYLQFAWDKHGESNFVFERLLICSTSDLFFYEQRAVDSFRPEYNVCQVAGSTLGIKLSDEVRARWSAQRRGENNPNFGKTHTPEARAKIAKARLGGVSAFKGRAHKEETKEILSLQRKGKSHNNGAKISAALKGKKRKPFTAEHRARIAAARKGKKLSPEHVEKLRKSSTGRIKSPETAAKLSASTTAYWKRKKACASASQATLDM